MSNKVSRLKKISVHDINNRSKAVAVINGGVYFGRIHSDCIDEYLEQYKGDNCYSYYKSQLPDEFDAANRHEDGYELEVNYEKIAFGHVDEKNKAIYIEPNTLQNMTLDEAAKILKEKCPDYNVYNDGTYDGTYENIWDKNDEIQKHMSTNPEDYEQIASINSRLKKKIARHDYDNRDCALMMVNGKIYVGDTHFDCVEDYKIDNVNCDEVAMRHHEDMNVNDEKMAFGHIDKKQKAIFIEPDTLQNMNIEEAANIIKQQYPDYDIYNDGTYGNEDIFNQNLSNNLEDYKKIASINYNIHDIVNKLYRTMPLVPTGDLIQDIYQDIQNGEYKICGDPNINWEKWQNRCKELLSQRGIIDIMDNRDYISANPIKQKDWNIIKTSRLNKKAEYIYCPYCNFDNGDFLYDDNHNLKSWAPKQNTKKFKELNKKQIYKSRKEYEDKNPNHICPKCKHKLQED